MCRLFRILSGAVTWFEGDDGGDVGDTGGGCIGVDGGDDYNGDDGVSTNTWKEYKQKIINGLKILSKITFF